MGKSFISHIKISKSRYIVKSDGPAWVTVRKIQKRKIYLMTKLFFRTRDRTFESVSHLIDFHRNNKLPIISAESALRLETPVRKVRR